MSPRLRRLLVLSFAWLPLVAGAQSAVGDGTSATAVDTWDKTGGSAYIGGFNSLFRLDLTTGVGTAVGTGYGFIGGAEVADMDGIAFAPDGTLYGVADSPRAALYRLSTASGRATLVGQFREGGQLLDTNTVVDGTIGFSCSGKLLLASRGLDRLFEVDTATAAVRSLGPLSVEIGAIAARGDDLLALGLPGTPGLFRLSEATAGTTALSGPLAARGYPAGAMAFADDGRLFVAIDNERRAPPVLLELASDGSSVVRETTITGAQFGTGPNSQPARTLAIAPPVCALLGPAAAVPVPSLDPRGLGLLALLLLGVAFLLRRRFAA